ncbi:MAG TPA: sulfatase-like hydrolase/transferase [Bryobacteraceae bacterium]|nr:sulfatase-like hydrolase/transferase [Bryobacteraceae bacterium]
MWTLARWSVVLWLAAAAASAQTPVILISVDTLRADHLGIYGYRRIATPNIDSFARGGTVFDAIDSQIPLTLPSHTALFTSTWPFANHVEENDGRVPAGVVTLAGVLHGRGYRTAAFVGSAPLDRHLGLDQGFDFYDSPFSIASEGPHNPLTVGVRRDGALVVRAARQWLGENHGQAVFAFLHFFDLHAPYSHAASTSGLPNTAGYDAEIEYVDRLLGQLQQALVAGGWWDRSLVVLLSDHGESLGDHGETSHGYFVYQSTLRTPLMVHWPAGTAGYPPRAAQPGGLIDVAPTILDFLKLPAPPQFSGASLLAAARSRKDDGRAVVSESVYPRDAFHWAPLRSIRAGAYQYIDAPKPELYDLSRDPEERHNLAGADAAMAAKLRGRLAEIMAQATPGHTTAGVSAERRRMLESLGYLGGSAASKASAQPGADPKDKLPEYNLFEQSLAAMYAGRYPEAMAGFRRLLGGDPRNSLARYYFADACLRAGQFTSALREWQNALQFDPEYVPAAEALGAWWMGRENYAKARTYFQKALAAAPRDSTALVEEGIAEEHLGLLPEALEHLEDGCRLAPDLPQCGHELETVKGKVR